MRINKFLAQASGLSRRAVDRAIEEQRVLVNGTPAVLGQDISDTDTVTLDGHQLQAAHSPVSIMLHKPTGYVVSREGQGSKTVYDLLPPELHSLKPVGRLDKASSGLLVLTSDGSLAHQLTHPSFAKQKCYIVELDRPLPAATERQIQRTGLRLADGISRFQLQQQTADRRKWKVIMSEGRNRQIRRTFAAAGLEVTKLHRTQFGPYHLGSLASGQFTLLDPKK